MLLQREPSDCVTDRQLSPGKTWGWAGPPQPGSGVLSVLASGWGVGTCTLCQLDERGLSGPVLPSGVGSCFSPTPGAGSCRCC